MVRTIVWFLFIPHIFLWGSCFWFCTCLSASPPLRLVHTQLVHTQLVHTQLFTHNLSTQNLSTHNCLHTTCPHTTCPHTTCPHTTCPYTTVYTQLVHTHNLSTQNLSTHNLSTHDLSTHNLSTCNLPHNLSTHNLSTHRGRRGTCWHPSSLCVAGVALGDIHRHFDVAGVALMWNLPKGAEEAKQGKVPAWLRRAGVPNQSKGFLRLVPKTPRSLQLRNERIAAFCMANRRRGKTAASF